MVALITFKIAENPIENEGASLRVVTALYIKFFRCARTANSVVGDGIWSKFKVIQAFMVVLITCKNEEDLFKNEGSNEVKTFPIISVLGSFKALKGS